MAWNLKFNGQHHLFQLTVQYQERRMVSVCGWLHIPHCVVPVWQVLLVWWQNVELTFCLKTRSHHSEGPPMAFSVPKINQKVWGVEKKKEKEKKSVCWPMLLQRGMGKNIHVYVGFTPPNPFKVWIMSIIFFLNFPYVHIWSSIFFINNITQDKFDWFKVL